MFSPKHTRSLARARGRGGFIGKTCACAGRVQKETDSGTCTAHTRYMTSTTIIANDRELPAARIHPGQREPGVLTRFTPAPVRSSIPGPGTMDVATILEQERAGGGAPRTRTRRTT